MRPRASALDRVALRPAPGGLAVGHLDKGSIATVLTVGVNAVGGLLFWFIAARRYDSTEVGSALALFQALLFVHYLTQLGLPMVIASRGSKVDEQSSKVFAWSLDARLVATLLIGAGFLAATRQADFMEPVRSARLGDLLFVLLAIGAGAGTLAEIRLVGRRAWGWVVARTAIPVSFRIPLVLLLGAGATGYDIFVVAALPICAMGALAAIALRAGPDRAPAWWKGGLDHRTLRRSASSNWAAMLATEGPIFAAPVIVAASVSSSENAPFLVAWNISAMTFVLPYMVGQVLLSESGKEDDLRASARRAYLVAQSLTCLITLMAWIGGGLIADFYGPDYSDLRQQLPILVGANIAWVITTISLSVARARDRSSQVVTLSILFAVSTLGPTLILAPRNGTVAAGWAWFTGNCVTGLVALWLQRDVWLRDPVDALPTPAGTAQPT